jgi:hypothetical protein
MVPKLSPCRPIQKYDDDDDDDEKLVPVHAMLAYGENIAPLILSLDTKQWRVVSFTSRPLYPGGRVHGTY